MLFLQGNLPALTPSERSTMNNRVPSTERPHQTTTRTDDTSEPATPRSDTGRAALVAGFGLLAMAIVAGLANFGAVEAILVDGNPAATGENLAESRTVFRLGVAGFGLVVVLDVVVAWALHVFFRDTSPTTSAVAASVRIVYGGILAVAAVQLAGAFKAGTDTEALDSIEAFQGTWNAGLVLFGTHLLVISWLAWKTVRVPNWLAALVAITGIGYVVDSVGTFASDTYSADITTFTFVGEVVLLFWLLIKGRGTASSRSIDESTETLS